MTEERKYSEKEIADIFKRASEDQVKSQEQNAKGEGLSLTELQKIGKETGLDPELIRRAATLLEDQTAEPAPSTFLGIRTGVARTVDLGGTLSDDDWNRLVLEIRETFRAHGKTDQEGSFRSWRNGNLKISVEPTSAGDRLRMQTTKGSAQASILGGLAAVGITLALMLSLVFSSGIEGARISIFAILMIFGLGASLFNAVRIPYWAKERERQMLEIGELARAIVEKRSKKKLAEAPESQLLDLDGLADATENQEESPIAARNRDRI